MYPFRISSPYLSFIPSKHEAISLCTFKYFSAGVPWQRLASDQSQVFSVEPTTWDETEACFAPMHVLPRSARAIIWPADQIDPISEGHILYSWSDGTTSWLWKYSLDNTFSFCICLFLFCSIYHSLLLSKLRFLNKVFENKPLSQALLPGGLKLRYYCTS